MADADSTTNHLADELSMMSLEDIQEKYRAVRIGEESDFGVLEATVDIDHSADLLYAIQCDQRVADAVQEIEWMPTDHEYSMKYHREDDDWDTEWHGTLPSKSNLASLQIHPIEMVDIGLTADEKSQWKGEVDIGSHSATFAILLCKLPNLSSLGLTGNGDLYKSFLDKVFRQASTQPNSTILSKLGKAYVCHCDTENGEQADVLKELVLIPSLKKLACHMLGDEGSNDYQCLQTEAGDIRTSNVEEVEFTQSQFRLEVIVEFLKPLVNLTKMDYEGYFEWAFFEEPGEDTMREKFVAAAGEMLEQRDLVWKMDADKIVIRKKELASEIDDLDEDKPGQMIMTREVVTMPDGRTGISVGFR